MRLFPALFLALMLPAPAAWAGETAWQEVAPGVQLRLVSTGVVKPDGSTMLGLEIDMPPDTKTYWRVPGETGFATELDFSGSVGVAQAQIVWPHPLVDVGADYVDYGYYGPTILPIAVVASDPHGKVNVAALLGICSEICVPAQANFALDLADAAPDRPNGLRIRQALAEAPIPWSEGAAPIGSVEYLPEHDAIGVWLADPSLDISSLIAATDTGEPLFGVPQKSQQDDLVLLPILAKTENSAVEGLEVQLSFLTAAGAYEVRRVIGSGKTTAD